MTTVSDDDDINADHDRMFALVARVTGTVAASAPKAEVLASLNELKEFFRPHFAREERLMDLLSYPDAERHRLAHVTWYEQLTSLIEDFARDDGGISSAVAAYLGTYSANHFTLYDLPFAHWRAARNPRGPS